MEEPDSIEIKRESQKSFAFHLKNDYFPTFHTNPNLDVFQFEHYRPQEYMVEPCHQTIGLSIWKKEKRKEMTNQFL